jgi:hypothetical protein
MTDYQKSKRRSDSTPAEKQTIADALDRETNEEYRKRVRMLEARVEELERIARSLGYCVDGRYE